MQSFLTLIKKIGQGFKWSFKESEPCFVTYGVSVLVGVLGFYFLNQRYFQDDLYEDFWLRCIAGILVIPIVFNKYLSQKMRRYLIWYWYVVLTYTLPFFFSFMILMNPLSNIWHINGMICLVVLILFVDISSLVILSSLGISAAVLYYSMIRTSVGPFVPPELEQVLYCYIGPIIYLFLFSRKKEKIQRHKLETMKMVAESIAHELRTPLSSVTMGSQALAKVLPYYCDAYDQAKKAKIPIKTLAPYQEKSLAELPEIMENVSRNANAMISMLLTNLKEEPQQKNIEVCSMAFCVQEALNAYPFAPGERELVLWVQPRIGGKGDFTFFGHIELTKHVLFNLIKNALYAISSAGKGSVIISLEPAKTTLQNTKNAIGNRLIFNDTGLGIPANKIKSIFDRFYSDKEHGTGIGLAFCRSTINQFGGEITCESTLGSYTTFTITLPSLQSPQAQSSLWTTEPNHAPS
jgi:signal transduction histidine kinase